MEFITAVVFLLALVATIIVVFALEEATATNNGKRMLEAHRSPFRAIATPANTKTDFEIDLERGLEYVVVQVVDDDASDYNSRTTCSEAHATLNELMDYESRFDCDAVLELCAYDDLEQDDSFGAATVVMGLRPMAATANAISSTSITASITMTSPATSTSIVCDAIKSIEIVIDAEVEQEALEDVTTTDNSEQQRQQPPQKVGSATLASEESEIDALLEDCTEEPTQSDIDALVDDAVLEVALMTDDSEQQQQITAAVESEPEVLSSDDDSNGTHDKDESHLAVNDVEYLGSDEANDTVTDIDNNDESAQDGNTAVGSPSLEEDEADDSDTDISDEPAQDDDAAASFVHLDSDDEHIQDDNEVAADLVNLGGDDESAESGDEVDLDSATAESASLDSIELSDVDSAAASDVSETTSFTTVSLVSSPRSELELEFSVATDTDEEDDDDELEVQVNETGVEPRDTNIVRALDQFDWNGRSHLILDDSDSDDSDEDEDESDGESDTDDDKEVDSIVL